MREQLQKLCVLFSIGGSAYGIIEMLWRGSTHWTMAVLGGALFVILGAFNECIPWDMPLAVQAVLGAVTVTGAELATGCIVNRWLGWNVWDYSAMPYNFLGQICLPFFLLWIPLSAVAIILDDFLRFGLFGEDWPHYR